MRKERWDILKNSIIHSLSTYQEKKYRGNYTKIQMTKDFMINMRKSAK
jgi:hypothetical protein